MDRPTKGSYDDGIVALLGRINSHKEFKTTSSCSGRITIIDCQSKLQEANKKLLKTKEKISALMKEF